MRKFLGNHAIITGLVAFLFLGAGVAHAAFYRTTGGPGFSYGYGYGYSYAYGYGYGYLNTSGDYGFFGTDGKVTGVSATPGDNSFTVSYSGSYYAKNRIQYGTDESFGSFSNETSFQIGNNSIEIAELDCDTTYYYRVRTTDGGGNVWYSTDSYGTVTTNECPVEEEEEEETPPRRRSGGGSFVGSPSVVNRTIPSSTGLSSSQIQSVLDVLRSFGTDDTVLANVRASLEGATTPTGDVRNLTLGMSGSDVASLQTLLIAQGYPIAAGATGFFGEMTRAALAKYQADHSITPAVGYFGPATREYMKAANLVSLWW